MIRRILDIRNGLSILSMGQPFRYCHAESKTPEAKPLPLQKYKTFKDQEQTVIFDVEEEKAKIWKEAPHQDHDLALNLRRGIHGVFDIEDLVTVLQRENAKDLLVCIVPKKFKYADYMCIVTGRSNRHMVSIAEFVRSIYKMKRDKTDVLPKIEGKNDRHWLALDLGNIILHIFSPEARKLYDLESLWSLGPEFDKDYDKLSKPIWDLFDENLILNENEIEKGPNGL